MNNLAKYIISLTLIQTIQCHAINPSINPSSNLPTFRDHDNKPSTDSQQLNPLASTRFQYPFIALVTDQKRQCGGALIKRNLVITAAHCMTDNSEYNVDKYKVYYHRYNLESEAQMERAVEKKVNTVIIHPEYKFTLTSGSPHDLALIVLDHNERYYKSVDLDSMIQLDDGKYSQIGEGARLLGWGTDPTLINTKQPQLPSKVLKQLNLNITSDPHCNFIGYLPGKHICAVGLKRLDTPCKGDSGGPLFHFDDSAGYVLVGVVSFGAPDCDGASAFVKIAAYRDFLDKLIGKYGLKDEKEVDKAKDVEIKQSFDQPKESQSEEVKQEPIKPEVKEVQVSVPAPSTSSSFAPTSQASPPSSFVPTSQTPSLSSSVPTSQASPPSSFVPTSQASPPSSFVPTSQASPPSSFVPTSQASPSSSLSSQASFSTVTATVTVFTTINSSESIPTQTSAPTSIQVQTSIPAPTSNSSSVPTTQEPKVVKEKIEDLTSKLSNNGKAPISPSLNKAIVDILVKQEKVASVPVANVTNATNQATANNTMPSMSGA